MSKKLVAYFSASGTTEKVAREIASASGADLFAIRPAVPYTKEDLDWNNPKSRSSIEMKDSAFRPALENQSSCVLQYDLIFLGFPIWWYTAPTIINSFLESCDFRGKIIVPFATSGSSGYGKTNDSLRASAPESIIHHGKMLNGGTLQEIAQWLATLGL